MIPRTQYARSGKVNIAYQVTGEGPLGSGLRFQDRGAHVLKEYRASGACIQQADRHMSSK